MTEDLREHLLHDHERWCGELVGLPDPVLDALHALDHAEEVLGLHGAYHQRRSERV